MRTGLGLPGTIAPVFWGMVFLEATFGAYLGIWPLWIDRLGAPVAVVGLLLGAGGFLRLAVLIPSAAIAERLGYRRAILISRAITGGGLLVAALATHWAHLLLMILAAATGELAFPLVQSLVAGLGGDQRLRSFTLVFAVGPSVALIVAPLISGALVDLWGMRAAFVLAAICTVVSLVCFARITDPPAAVQSAGNRTSTYRAAAADSDVRLVVGLLLAAVFALSLGTSFIPVFLEDVRGMSPATIASLSAAGAAGSAGFGLAVARLRRLHASPFLAVAIAVTATVLGFVLFRSTAAMPLVLLAFVCRGGLFSTWALLAATLGELAPAVHRARAFALGEMAGGIAFALGPMAAGPLYERRPSLPLELAAALGISLVPVFMLAQRHANRLHGAESSPAPALDAADRPS